MKYPVLDALLLSCGVASAGAASVAGTQSLSLRHTSHPSDVPHYGDTACPCIGFDNIEGQTSVELENGKHLMFPADLGARCEKWDNGVHPGCKEGQTPGFGNKWCGQAWCFVDACNCDIPVMPQTSVYVPDARYRGRPIFYSYATCGGEDVFAKELPKLGVAGCRCIGFDDVPGTISITLDGKTIDYPAEIGGKCKAWDWDMHTLCQQGKESPSWCKARWCYVDPCSCSTMTPPRTSMYLPEATFTGKGLYYSYETCGSRDDFTMEHNVNACVNQFSEAECMLIEKDEGVSKCAWTGKKCLGSELVNHPLCTKAMGQDEEAKGQDEEAKGHDSGAATLGKFAVIHAALAAMAVAALAA